MNILSTSRVKVLKGTVKSSTPSPYSKLVLIISRLYDSVSPMENSQGLKKRSPAEEMKLAAAAISLNVRLRSSDMPTNIQEHAMRCARSLVDSAPKRRPNLTHLARALKKVRKPTTLLAALISFVCARINSGLFQEFDSEYGPAWHCVVGTSFGSFVTHSPGGFLYFSVDSLSVLLFKTEVLLVMEPDGEKRL